jgi:hypothetical protein
MARNAGRRHCASSLLTAGNWTSRFRHPPDARSSPTLSARPDIPSVDSIARWRSKRPMDNPCTWRMRVPVRIGKGLENDIRSSRVRAIQTSRGDNHPDKPDTGPNKKQSQQILAASTGARGDNYTAHPGEPQRPIQRVAHPGRWNRLNRRYFLPKMLLSSDSIMSSRS